MENMTDKKQLEMHIHGVKDNLDSIEFKLQNVYEKINTLINKLDQHEEMFKAIEEKLK